MKRGFPLVVYCSLYMLFGMILCAVWIVAELVEATKKRIVGK